MLANSFCAFLTQLSQMPWNKTKKKKKKKEQQWMELITED